MANTEELINLMIAAADRLEEERPDRLVQLNTTSNGSDMALRSHAVSLAASTAYAAAILRFAAACMNTDEPEQADG